MSGFMTVSGADYLLGMFGAEERAVESYYVALVSETSPGITSDGDDLEEPGDDSYTRAVLANQDGNWEISHSCIINTVEVSFPIAVSDWGQIRYWAITDSYESGRVFWVGEFANPFFIGADDQLILPPASISIGFEMFGWNG